MMAVTYSQLHQKQKKGKKEGRDVGVVCMMSLLQGRTGPLEQLPRELQRGHYLSLGPGRTSLFMGSVDRNTITWSLNSKVPQTRVQELNTLFQDPSAAKVANPSLAYVSAQPS